MIFPTNHGIVENMGWKHIFTIRLFMTYVWLIDYLHVWYIYLYIWLNFMGFHVDKHTLRPLDGMGDSIPTIGGELNDPSPGEKFASKACKQNWVDG